MSFLSIVSVRNENHINAAPKMSCIHTSTPSPSVPITIPIITASYNTFRFKKVVPWWTSLINRSKQSARIEATASTFQAFRVDDDDDIFKIDDIS